MSARVRVTVNLLAGDAEWVRAEAEAFGMSLSEVVQSALAGARARQEQANKAARRVNTKKLEREIRAELARLDEFRQLDLFIPHDERWGALH